MTWPAGEGFDFDPQAIRLSGSSGVLGAIPVDTLLQPERWNRLSLQMRPDGTISVAIGDSVVAVHPAEMRNDSTVRWRVMVMGHSVDNRLLLRELALWREERVPSGEVPMGQRTP